MSRRMASTDPMGLSAPTCTPPHPQCNAMLLSSPHVGTLQPAEGCLAAGTLQPAEECLAAGRSTRAQLASQKKQPTENQEAWGEVPRCRGPTLLGISRPRKTGGRSWLAQARASSVCT